MKIKRLKDFGWGSSVRGTWELFVRHGRTAARHLTVRRFLNCIFLGAELILRRRRVISRPIAIKIEPTNICNFRCPGCRTGSGLDKSPRGRIDFDLFKKIVDETCAHALKLILYMWGEPLLHKDIFRMVRYAADRNLAVQLSSNMNVFKEGYAEQLVDCGLEHLIVALDGVSQSVYETYRVGGSVQRVIDNVTKVVEARAKAKRRFPVVELQYIIFPHNRHEVALAEELARDLGVDILTFIESWTNEQQQPADGELPDVAPDKCNSLWLMACFNWDGRFTPCCDSVDDDFGNICDTGFDQLWNSVKMQKSRSLQTSRPMRGGPKTICAKCRIYGSRVVFVGEAEPTPTSMCQQ